jgi:hypothetical protein
VATVDDDNDDAAAAASKIDAVPDNKQIFFVMVFFLF